MAYDLAQLEAALVKADAAGDADAARAFAAEIRKLKAEKPAPKLAPTPSPEPKKEEKPPQRFVPSGEQDQPSWLSPQGLAGNPITRFAMGVASPVLGGVQLLDEATGGHVGVSDHLRRLEELKQQGRKEQGSEGFDWTETAGNIMSPAWQLLLRALGPAAQTLLGRTAQSGAAGAVGGAVTPVTNDKNFWDEKGVQTAVGAGGGAVLQPIAELLKRGAGAAYHGAIEPWLAPAAIKGRAYLDAAGDKTKEIIELLTRNRQIVPGSRPTAGEAAAPAGRAEFSALQKSAERVAPSPYDARTQQQNQARVATIETIAGDAEKLAAAKQAREDAVAPLYAEGQKQQIVPRPLEPKPTQPAPQVAEWELRPDKPGQQIPRITEMEAFRALAERPSMQAAVARAEKLIEEETGQHVSILAKGHKLTGDEALKIKKAFDDLIMLHPKAAIESAEMKALKDSRTVYLEMMESQFPSLGKARSTYKEMSGPVNQMEVGQALKDKLVPALSDEAKQRASVYANAVRESAGLIKKATGEPRFTSLDQVLTKEQMAAVESVRQDLARGVRFEELARKGASSPSGQALDVATRSMESDIGGRLPNMLERGVMVANAIIRRTEGKLNKKLAAEIAAEMLDPPKVGAALETARRRAERIQVLSDAISKHKLIATAGATSSALQSGD